MKSMLAIAFGLFNFNALAGYDPYAFVKNFELVKIEVKDTTAAITVKHKKTHRPTRFELIPGQACLMSLPAVCSGTIVRLDNQVRAEGDAETTFSVNLADLYYEDQTSVRIAGPNKEIVVKY